MQHKPTLQNVCCFARMNKFLGSLCQLITGNITRLQERNIWERTYLAIILDPIQSLPKDFVPIKHSNCLKHSELKQEGE